MDNETINVLRQIKAMIESLPKPPDDIGFAGQTEQMIAHLYRRVGDEQSAGNWYVRSALEAEKYGQVLEAVALLEWAAKELPSHLVVRKERDRMRSKV